MQWFATSGTFNQKQEVASSGHADIILNVDMFMHRTKFVKLAFLKPWTDVWADLIKKEKNNRRRNRRFIITKSLNTVKNNYESCNSNMLRPFPSLKNIKMGHEWRYRSLDPPPSLPSLAHAQVSESSRTPDPAGAVKWLAANKAHTNVLSGHGRVNAAKPNETPRSQKEVK